MATDCKGPTPYHVAPTVEVALPHRVSANPTASNQTGLIQLMTSFSCAIRLPRNRRRQTLKPVNALEPKSKIVLSTRGKPRGVCFDVTASSLLKSNFKMKMKNKIRHLVLTYSTLTADCQWQTLLFCLVCACQKTIAAYTSPFSSFCFR